MKRIIAFIIIIISLFSTHGAKRMNEKLIPFHEHLFVKPVIFMFPMMRQNTIGIYYGLDEHEKIAFVTMKDGSLQKDNFKGDNFDWFMTTIYPQVDPEILTIAQKSSVGVLDLRQGKQIIDYRPRMPNFDIRNEYKSGKSVDVNNHIVLSLFHPFITPENKAFYCYSLVLEDLKNNTVLKRLRVNEESLETIFIGKRYTYFLDCFSDGKTITYNWRAVDDRLEFVDHPLLPLLDDQWKIIYSDAVLVSESQECAVSRGALRDDPNGRPFFRITPWVENRPPVPIVLPDKQRPSPYISRKTFTVSPSGRWLFLYASTEDKDDVYYLMYIDKKLLNYYLPPIKIDVGGENFEVTWMQEPEGFVVHDGKKLRYWDLSGFDPEKWMKR